MDRKNVYIFRIYYSPVYGAEDFIKFEVNFRDFLKAKFKGEIVSEELIKKIKSQLKKLQKDISIGEKGW